MRVTILYLETTTTATTSTTTGLRKGVRLSGVRLGAEGWRVGVGPFRFSCVAKSHRSCIFGPFVLFGACAASIIYLCSPCNLLFCVDIDVFPYRSLHPRFYFPEPEPRPRPPPDLDPGVV